MKRYLFLPLPQTKISKSHSPNKTVQFYPEEELLCDFEPENGIFYMKPRGWYDQHHKGNDHRAMWKAVRFCKEKGVTVSPNFQLFLKKLM
jgi:hypothetical protein